MVDDVNKTVVLLAILAVVSAFAVGAWLTNFGAGRGVPATGGGVDPDDWSAAANMICADTNAELVEMGEEIGADRADVASREMKILARRVDGIAALPGPSGRGRSVEALVRELRLLQADRDATGSGAGELESEELTRVAYQLDIPWCVLFGADDAAVRTRASQNVRALRQALDEHRSDTGGYEGAAVELLRERHGLGAVDGEVTISRASEEGYCVESTVGYYTSHLEHPGGSEPLAGPC